MEFVCVVCCLVSSLPKVVGFYGETGAVVTAMALSAGYAQSTRPQAQEIASKVLQYDPAKEKEEERKFVRARQLNAKLKREREQRRAKAEQAEKKRQEDILDRRRKQVRVRDVETVNETTTSDRRKLPGASSSAYSSSATKRRKYKKFHLDEISDVSIDSDDIFELEAEDSIDLHDREFDAKIKVCAYLGCSFFFFVKFTINSTAPPYAHRTQVRLLSTIQVELDRAEELRKLRAARGAGSVASYNSRYSDLRTEYLSDSLDEKDDEPKADAQKSKKLNPQVPITNNLFDLEIERDSVQKVYDAKRGVFVNPSGSRGSLSSQVGTQHAATEVKTITPRNMHIKHRREKQRPPAAGEYESEKKEPKVTKCAPSYEGSSVRDLEGAPSAKSAHQQANPLRRTVSETKTKNSEHGQLSATPKRRDTIQSAQKSRYSSSKKEADPLSNSSRLIDSLDLSSSVKLKDAEVIIVGFMHSAFLFSFLTSMKSLNSNAFHLFARDFTTSP